jgi:dihydroflavonol-4-reductase
VRILVRRSSNIEYIKDLEVEIVYGDLLNSESLALALKGCDTLYHAAALYEIRLSRNQKKTIHEINVDGTRNVLTAALKEGVEKAVYTSSIATMAGPREDDLITEDIQCNEPLPSPYSQSKYRAEVEAFKICQEGLPLVIVNPTWVIGPGDYKPTPSGRVIVDFLNRKMPGYINYQFNLIYVKDVVKGHILAAKKGRIGERYILGGQNISMKAFMELLAEISGINPPKRIPRWLILLIGYFQAISSEFTGKPPMIPLEFVKETKIDLRCDCSKAYEELGLQPTPIREGLIETVTWYQEMGYVSVSKS